MLGAWFLDRRVRRSGSLSRRHVALAAYSASVLVLYWALAQLPSSILAADAKCAIIAAASPLAAGWLAIAPIAAVAFVVSAAGAVIARMMSRAAQRNEA